MMTSISRYARSLQMFHLFSWTALGEPTRALECGERKGATAESEQRFAKLQELLEQLGSDAASSLGAGKGGARAALLMVLAKLALTSARDLAEVTGACHAPFAAVADVPFI